MSKTRISFDSCAIVHLLSENPTWFPYLEPIYNEAVAGKLEIIVSEVSIAECTRLESTGPRRIAPEEASKIIAKFFRRNFMIRRGVTSRESEFAAELIHKHRIGTCDALIAATALFAGATTLYTSDGCTGRRKDGKLLTVGKITTSSGLAMDVVDPSHGAVAKALLNPKP